MPSTRQTAIRLPWGSGPLSCNGSLSSCSWVFPVLLSLFLSLLLSGCASESVLPTKPCKPVAPSLVALTPIPEYWAEQYGQCPVYVEQVILALEQCNRDKQAILDSHAGYANSGE